MPARTGAARARALVLDNGHKSKAGNARVQRVMVELAWLRLRHQPGSALSRWFAERVGALNGRIRRIAIVALARKLLIALWRDVETGLLPAGATLKA